MKWWNVSNNLIKQGWLNQRDIQSKKLNIFCVLEYIYRTINNYLDKHNFLIRVYSILKVENCCYNNKKSWKQN